jgi:hypothetical protein
MPITLTPVEEESAIPAMLRRPASGPAGVLKLVPVDPLDDFDEYNFQEDQKEEAGYDETDPGLASQIWGGVKNLVTSTVKGVGAWAGGATNDRANKIIEERMAAGEPMTKKLLSDARNQQQAEAVALEAAALGEASANVKRLVHGTGTAAKKAWFGTREALSSDPTTEAAMKRESRRASWEFARKAREIDGFASGFNGWIAEAAPALFADIKDVKVDPEAAQGLANAMDPLNLVPGGVGFKLGRAPLAGSVRGATTVMKATALDLAKATAEREALTLAVRAASGAEKAALAKELKVATNTALRAEAEDVSAREAMQATIKQQGREMAVLAPTMMQRAGGAIARGAGAVVEGAGKVADAVAEMPGRIANRIAPASNEAARDAVMESVNAAVRGAGGLVGAIPALSGSLLKGTGRNLKAFGELLGQAEGQLPFFRELAKKTNGLPSWTAGLVDRSGIAPLVESTGRTTAAGAQVAPIGAATGYLGSGGDPRGAVIGAGTASFLGMSGAGFGQWVRARDPMTVKRMQNADLRRYKRTLDPVREKYFSSLSRDDQVGLATMAQANPDMEIRLVRLGKDADGMYHIGENGGVAHINMDSPRPLRPIVAHEVGHHISSHGLDGTIQRTLLGDEITGEPGIFTLVDKDGVAVRGADGRLQTTPEFQALKNEYNAKIAKTEAASGGRIGERGDADLAREIFAEHAADLLLDNDKVTATMRANPLRGALDSLAESALVRNVPALKQLLGKQGVVFDAQGNVVGSGLFGALRRSPELSSQVRKYVEALALERKPPSLDDKPPSVQYDIADVKKNPEILTKLFDASGEVARGPSGQPILKDGMPVILTEAQQAKVNRSLTEKVVGWIEANPKAAEAAGLRLETRTDPKGKTEQVYAGSQLPPPLLEELAKDKNFNPAQIKNLAVVGGLVKAGKGDAVLMFYQPAKKSGSARYRSLQGDWRTETPYAIEVSKAGNVYVRTASREKLVANAEKLIKQRKAGLWNGELAPLLADMDAYLANHANGRPGEMGLGVPKRDALNDLFGVRTKDNASRNPIFDTTTRKPGDIIFRSRRIDRMNKVTPVDERFLADYQKVKMNLRPAE